MPKELVKVKHGYVWKNTGPKFADDAGNCIICGEAGRCHCKENGANNRLRDAAPDMFAAMKNIAEGLAFPEDNVQKAILEVVRRHISKIEGQK